jgi:flagellar motor switch protein FliG
MQVNFVKIYIKNGGANMLEFKDIVGFGNSENTQILIRDVMPKDWALALMDMDEDFREVIFGNMSSRMAGTIRNEIQSLRESGETMDKDIEAAQIRITTQLNKLIEDGEILISK